MGFSVGVLTISDKGSQGEREDLSGPAVQQWVEKAGGNVTRSEILPDEAPIISAKLIEWADSNTIDVIITTGGTGLTPRDVTPEATKQVLDREIPGIAEGIRIASLQKTPLAMLSRAVAGHRGRTLIVNLPGSPKAVAECMEVLLPVLSHVIAALAGPLEHG